MGSPCISRRAPARPAPVSTGVGTPARRRPTAAARKRWIVIVNFNDGNTNNDDVANTNRVRCVR